MSEHTRASGRDLQSQKPHSPPEGISESDYEAIEDAVMETARGRWFLKEYARRMRASETASLRSALERIERIVSHTHAPLAEAQAQQRVCEGIGRVAERLSDITWYMRERGFSASVCTSIDEEARQLAGLMDLLSAPAEHESVETAAAPVRASAVHQDGVVIDGELRPVATFDAAAEQAECAEQQALRAAATDNAPAIDRVAAFASLSGLSTQQKLAMFA